MLCYLLTQLADSFEVEATKPSTEVIIGGKVCLTKHQVQPEAGVNKSWIGPDHINPCISLKGQGQD